MKKSEKISTLEQLIHELNTSDPCYPKIGNRLALDADEFLAHAVWSNDRYTRVCISKTPDYELLLLCWPPNSSTSIHCHNNEECWVHLIQGEFEESIFDYNAPPLKLKKKHRMKTICTSYMNDTIGLHKLHNVSSERALSLHLYVGPIDQCKSYQEMESRFEQKTLTYDKVVFPTV